MSTEDNKELVLRWKEIWSKRDLSLVDELYASDYLGHFGYVPETVRGREAFKDLIAAYLAAFDVEDTPEFLIAEGEMVAIHDAVRLKHKGEFQGIPPTGKEASVTSTDIYRIVDGKIVEQWVEGDMLSFMQQLGVLPTPGQGES